VRINTGPPSPEKDQGFARDGSGAPPPTKKGAPTEHPQSCRKKKWLEQNLIS
jgi:hypothetical protein